jgi:hypothetical protein
VPVDLGTACGTGDGGLGAEIDVLCGATCVTGNKRLTTT